MTPSCFCHSIMHSLSSRICQKSYVLILMKFGGGVRHGTSQLDCALAPKRLYTPS